MEEILGNGVQLNVQIKVLGDNDDHKYLQILILLYCSFFDIVNILLRRVCTVCEFNTKKTTFSLRGLCHDSRHDRIYVLEKDGQNKPFFKGLSTSIIKWVSLKCDLEKHE